MQTLNDQTNKSFMLTALATRFQVKANKNNQGFYLDFVLMTKEHSLTVRKWNFNEYDQTNLVDQKRVVIQAYIRENFFKNRKQYIIDKYEVINGNISDFIPTAPMETAQMWQRFLEFVELIEDADYKKLIQAICVEEPTIKTAFQTKRAGVTFHHSVSGGLLWHTLTILEAAAKLHQVYHYLTFNLSLLYAGIILHDLGKVYEIGDFFDDTYTIEGQLIGHISLGAMLVDRYASKLQTPPNKVLLLKHCILASHGQLEFGSPVQPATAEAFLLTSLDNLDAKLNAIYKDFKDTKLGHFTNKKYTDFAKQGFYKHLDK